MPKAVSTIIDSDACIGCERCIQVCPLDTLSMQNGKAVVSGSESLWCDHCVAVCPANAIRVEGLDADWLKLETVENHEKWLPFGDSDTGELVRLMRSRRSCRNYTDKPVPLEVLNDLVKIGTTAPSGSNSQLWTFTILPTRDTVVKLGEHALRFFEKINNMAAKSSLRMYSKVFMKDALGIYHREYSELVSKAIADFKSGGKDRMFHGAPALILVGSKEGASCPVEDALLATQNVLLAAHSMGYGTCLIGFAVEAVKRDASIRRFLQLNKDEKIHAVIALGEPKEKWVRLTGRRAITPRIING